MALTDTETRRLIKLLGMMGSEFIGERATAAQMATDLIRSKGMTWETYIAGGRSLRPDPEPRPRAPEPPPQPKAEWKARPDCTILEVELVADPPGAKAILVRQGKDGHKVWLPRSQIEVIGTTDTPEGVWATIDVPNWLVRSKHLRRGGLRGRPHRRNGSLGYHPTWIEKRRPRASYGL